MKISTKEILDKAILSENEVRLVVKRANDSDTREDTISALNRAEAWDLSLEQNAKGIAWLRNEWRTPKGVERKNNPFGAREEAVIEDFTHFTFDGLYDAGNYQNHWYTPIYTAHSAEGSFQYIMKGGKISIIG